jgi:hypothetical protein
MVTLEAGPDTVVMSKFWAEALENSKRAADERADRTELELLITQEREKAAYQDAVRREEALQHRAMSFVSQEVSAPAVPERPGTWDDVKYKRYCIALFFALAFVVVFVAAVAVEHWEQVQGWVR